MTVSAITSRLTTTKRKADRPAPTPPKQLIELTLAEMPRLGSVSVQNDRVTFTLQDERVVSFPIEWSPKLLAATPDQRQRVEVSDFYAFWDDIDEIIGVRNVLYGHRLLVPKPQHTT